METWMLIPGKFSEMICFSFSAVLFEGDAKVIDLK
jgi:hypothetical protein